MGRLKLSMKRLVAALVGFVAMAWSGMAFAQTTIMCASLANFVCAYSAAETMSLVTQKPNTPGQPDVYLGYLAFGSDGTSVTFTGTSNINGTVNPNFTLFGTCADAPSAMQPATITFPAPEKSEIAFVTDTGGTELQFILIQDKSSSKPTVANSVRVGVCRKQ